MATQTKNATGFDRFQEMNEQFLDAGRKAGEAYLDTTEKTLDGLADLELKVADATRVELISTAVTAHAHLTRDLGKLYLSTTRELLAK